MRPQHAVLALLPVFLFLAQTLKAAEVTIAPNRALLVDGKPFFPLFVWLQPTELIDLHKDLGVNALMAEGANREDTAEAFLDALAERGMYGVIHFRDEHTHLKDHPALLTWMFGDEPDLPGQTPFQPPAMDGAMVLIEAEEPVESTFPERSWLVQEHAQLSGGRWLNVTQDALPPEPFTASYGATIPETGTYVLWDRGSMKTWASPTRWRFDGGEWQTSPRDARTIEGRRIGTNQTVGWHRYGEADLDAGQHVFEIAVQDGRTLGKAAEVGEDILFGADLFLLTTSQDEPQTPFQVVPRITPEEIAGRYTAKQAADSARPIYLNLTARFWEPQRQLPVAVYEGFCEATDIVGFDHYPIYGWGRPDRIHEIAQVTAALRELAGEGKPVWAILEVTNGSRWVREDMRPPTPEEIRAEVWMAIVNGATGIGYFPHAWKPTYSQCRIPEENQAEIKRLNAQITELTPVILGEPIEGVTCQSEGELPVDVMAREGGNGTYVFAVNLLREEREAKLTVPGLAAGAEVEVVGEGRTLTADQGGFSDAFGELEVHIYRTRG